jgi:sugar phosphate isomerase/epimerase
MTRDGRFIRTTALGTGIVDFKEQMRRLKRDDFQGYILLEGTVQHTDNVLEDAKKTLEYFRELEKTV